MLSRICGDHTRVMFLTLFGSLVLANSVAAESEFITLNGKVSDRDFHRAVACAALPGQDCTETMVHWPDDAVGQINLKLHKTQPAFIERHGTNGTEAIDRAIAEINAVGSALQLVRDDKADRAAINIWLTDLSEGDAINIEGSIIPKTEIIEAAYVYVSYDDAGVIDRADIVVSNLEPEELTSIILEEITQANGLLRDVDGDAYRDTSIFSENSNAITTLEGQDRAAILLHYPKN
jgi:hypothetical protein